jgi:hypothetical protein
VPRYVAQGIEQRQCAFIDATNIDLTAAGNVAEQIRAAISFRDVDATKQINYLRIFTTGTNIFYYSYTVVGYKYF